MLQGAQKVGEKKIRTKSYQKLPSESSESFLKVLRVTISYNINQYLRFIQILEASKHCGTWQIGEATW